MAGKGRQLGGAPLSRSLQRNMLDHATFRSDLYTIEHSGRLSCRAPRGLRAHGLVRSPMKPLPKASHGQVLCRDVLGHRPTAARGRQIAAGARVIKPPGGREDSKAPDNGSIEKARLPTVAERTPRGGQRVSGRSVIVPGCDRRVPSIVRSRAREGARPGYGETAGARYRTRRRRRPAGQAGVRPRGTVAYSSGRAGVQRTRRHAAARRGRRRVAARHRHTSRTRWGAGGRGPRGSRAGRRHPSGPSAPRGH
jgi:hypothetical protein